MSVGPSDAGPPFVPPQPEWPHDCPQEPEGDEE